MPAHAETQILPYTPEQLFDLVADVARYHEFLPWCKASRVMVDPLSQQNGPPETFLGELVICYKHFCESYTSRVSLTPYEAIDVVMVKGPFTHLSNRWRFSPAPGGTRVEFSLDFSFRSKMLEKLMGGFFTRATQKMVGAFKDRAEALYGKPLTES